jgi:hypothetical protein
MFVYKHRNGKLKLTCSIQKIQIGNAYAMWSVDFVTTILDVQKNPQEKSCGLLKYK